MKPILRQLLAIAGASATCLASYAQNLVVNGSFETPVLQDWHAVLPTNALAPWQTTDNSFEVWTNIPPSFYSADGTQNLEILSAAANATVWQTIPTTPGEDYAFSFYHTPRNGVDSVLTVAINSQVVATFFENGAQLTGSNWRRFKTNFTATATSTTISFLDMAAYTGGTHIDNVVVERLPLRVGIWVSEVELCWETVTNKVYQLQYRSALTTNTWRDLGAATWGSGTTTCVNDAVPGGEPQKFYRVLTVP